MKKHDYYLLDVFTDRAFSGNPLAVFPHADELDSSAMQAMANELNLSETVFVGKATDAAFYPIRIFTPTMELPFSGHPVVGTAHLLTELDMVQPDRPLMLKAGVGALVVDYEDDLARFTAATPVYLYVIGKAKDEECSIHSRMFSTEGGIREDPATGSAAAALAGYLAVAKPCSAPCRWEIHQGIEMGRPSRIFAETEGNGNASLVRIAGQAVVVGSGTLYTALT